MSETCGWCGAEDITLMTHMRECPVFTNTDSIDTAVQGAILTAMKMSDEKRQPCAKHTIEYGREFPECEECGKD